VYAKEVLAPICNRSLVSCDQITYSHLRILIVGLGQRAAQRGMFHEVVVEACLHQGFGALSLFWRDNDVQLFPSLSRMNFQ
jgi:hypothetical protein